MPVCGYGLNFAVSSNRSSYRVNAHVLALIVNVLLHLKEPSSESKEIILAVQQK